MQIKQLFKQIIVGAAKNLMLAWGLFLFFTVGGIGFAMGVYISPLSDLLMNNAVVINVIEVQDVEHGDEEE